MITSARKLGALLPPVLLVLSFAALAERELYRYYNDKGNLVVDYQVPVEYVKKGYEVINEEGIVLRVVPKELNEEELAERNAEEKRARAAEAEAERLRQWDESLMLRYSTIEDIEAARERGLHDLRIRVSILKSNKRSLKQQVESYQSQAADLERRGQPVHMDRLKNIEALQQEIVATDRAIEEREREVEELSASYEADIQRFEMLLDMVELRRTLLMAKDDE